MSYSEELEGLREALELPTVGRLRQAGDLDRLRHLVKEYVDESEQIYSELFGPL
ncbi:hypothetical protein GCM10023196_053910 [Actinoallomurus vinaceus]|uniref:FXSXX-COOH protein n=1 Tax=Actinoallomurus vinaceus TaxID=1080074 RepID=A0ABP8UEE2_9ACTN